MNLANTSSEVPVESYPTAVRVVTFRLVLEWSANERHPVRLPARGGFISLDFPRQPKFRRSSSPPAPQAVSSQHRQPAWRRRSNNDAGARPAAPRRMMLAIMQERLCRGEAELLNQVV